MFEVGYNCKIQINAKDLNGKLVIEIVRNEAGDAFIFMQPNGFNDAAGTHGILENNMVYQIQGETGGVYEVPTDWTITLVYNVGYFKGGL